MGLGRTRGRLGALTAVLVVFATACNGLTVDQRGVYTAQQTTTLTGDVTVAEGQTALE